MIETANAQYAKSEIAFDLNVLPATRIETHRQLGFWITAFCTPFVLAIAAGCFVAANQGAPVIAMVGGLFLLVVLAVWLYGINCMLTKIIVQISSSLVRQQEVAFWKNREWQESLDDYRLQIKVLTSREQLENRSSISIGSEEVLDNEVGHLKHTFHIRLVHKNDLRSIELFDTESSDQLRDQFRTYQTQLRVKVDSRIRDFNTDHPIEDLDLYGLGAIEA